MLRFHIITIFPDMFVSYLSDSIIGRALHQKKIKITFYNPRDFTRDSHKKVDDKPYGGGPGMVMSVDPIVRAWKKARGSSQIKKFKTIIFSPGGNAFTNGNARSYITHYTDIIMICGRYEGIDARVRIITDAEEISIGDYVLTGGELPALVVIDATTRHIRGVLGTYESLEEERVASHEMYTRPDVYQYKKKKYSVPRVLLSGNHKEIDKWRAISSNH